MANFADRSGINGLSMFPPVIKWLLASNLLIFVTMQFASEEIQAYIVGYGALWPAGSALYFPWQYITYLFMHAGIGHIFFNMLALWMFGMELEQTWGSKRFLLYYMACGLGAGLIQTFVTMASGTEGPTVGASGAIMGVLIAFGMMFPDRIIYVQFFLPLKAKYAVLLFIAIDLFAGFGANDNVAHFAHLGGALTGFIIMILLMPGGRTALGGIFGRRREPTVVAVPPPNRAQVIDVQFRDSNPASNRHAPQTMDFGNEQERIDAILDKISHTGYQTLTDEEKRILTEASKRMR